MGGVTIELDSGEFWTSHPPSPIELLCELESRAKVVSQFTIDADCGKFIGSINRAKTHIEQSFGIQNPSSRLKTVSAKDAIARNKGLELPADYWKVL